MSKQLRIWLFVLLGTLLTSTTLLAEGVITMTTTKDIFWETIKLNIEAKGPVSIDGVQESARTDGGSKGYTLTSQTITIRGDVTKLDCSWTKLTSLDVSDCTSLKELSCFNNQLTSLKVSGCTALTTLDCRNNKLTSLNVSGCTSLTKLDCTYNQLTSLDVSGCTALTKFICRGNQLTNLDVSKNTALTWLSCKGNQLTSLDVSGCTALTRLGCEDNKLTSFNASGCTALTEVDCSENQLTSFNASGCTALTKLDCSKNQLTSLNVSGCISLTKLTCYDNPLTRIDLSNCKLLKAFFTWYGGKLISLDVSGCTALTTLECDGNQLTSLNVSGCTSLTKLNCYRNQLTSLDVSGCTALTELECTHNPLTSINLSNCTSLEEFTWKQGKLTSLDVSGCTALTWLYCSYNQLTNLDVSSCTALKVLDCAYNQLTSLDVSKNTALTGLYCSNNQLTSLDLSGNTALTELYCSSNQLTSLDVSGCSALTWLHCDNNPLTSINLSNCTSLKEFTWKQGKLTNLDVSGCTSLTELDCFSNQLNSLNVSGCTALTWLYCSYNQLNSLNASGCIALTELDCSDSPLTSLNLSNCKSLKVFTWNKKELTSLDVSGCTALTTLSCFGNQLTSLNVLSCTALTTLSCFGNQLTSLNVLSCTALTELYCGNNQLTNLDVSKNTALTELYCGNNQLTNLDVSKNTALTRLSCSSNQLSSLDVSKNTALTELYCAGNQINGEDMTKLVNSLPDRKGMSSGTLGVVKYSSEKKDQNWCSFADVSTASEKNWSVQKYGSYSWESYPGVGEGVITMTTAKAVGEKIKLGIVANGDVVIEGVSEMPQLGRNRDDYTLTSQTITIRGDVTELACGGNQLTSLDVSDCPALTYLKCYKNRLRGEAMTQMVAGLSDRNEKVPGSLYVVCDESDENNLLRSDVLAASRKNWRVFKYLVNAGKSVLYSGAGSDDEIVMTITQEQYLAGGIRLAILSDGDVTIEGVHEKRIFTDGSAHTYTLAGTQITIRGNVTELDCSKNQLTNLDLSKCNSLWTLRCSDNKLTSLNASGSSLLTEINCSSNQLPSLDVSSCISLKTLKCNNNQLTALNISGCAALKTLYCYSNCINGEAMTKLVNSLPDRKGMSSGALRVIDYDPSEKRDENWCSFADVATASGKNWAVQKYESSWDSYPGVGEGVITMTTSKAVRETVELKIGANGDVVIEGVSEMPQLGSNHNNYTLTSQTIIIRGDVTELDCVGNQLTSLDVSGCTSLTNLDCNNNQLSSLELLQNSALTSLDCSRNKLESLDLSACTRLKSLTCYRNKIRGNAVAQLVESLPDRYGKEPGKFYFVYYSVNEYEENFCYRPAVGRANDKNWRPQKGYNNRYEILWEDYFGVIDEGVVMMHTAQEVGSQITLTLEAKGDVAIDGVKGVPETDGKPHQYTLISQDVTIRGYVTKLYCSGNKLTSLDLSTTVPLVELDCSNNQLTALDVSQNAALTSLACYRNRIKGEAMAQLIKGLPQLPLRSTHLFGIVSNAADEGNVFLKADVEHVRDKGWSPMKWDEERHQYEPYAGKETETFAVTLTKEGKGTITATGADDLTAVPYGTELTIVATPTEGYELISLTAGEEDILATKKVVVTDNVTVKATFDEATFAVTLTKEGEGTISATGAEDLKAVPYGTELTIVATPATGYELTALTANGKDILATKKVVIKGATEVKATFVDHTGVETTVTQQVQLYPNPATDHIIVEGVVPASEVTLHSLTGERLYAGRTDSRGVLQIDLTPYADGVYLVCVAGETYRVVVRR